MSTVDFIFRIVIFHICMSLLESILLSFCRPRSKLDLPTLRQGSRERKNATEQKKRHSLGFESRSSAYRADALPTELRCQLEEPES